MNWQSTERCNPTALVSLNMLDTRRIRCASSEWIALGQEVPDEKSLIQLSSDRYTNIYNSINGLITVNGRPYNSGAFPSPGNADIIMTCAPIPGQFGTFWNLIYQYNIPVIFVLGADVEKQKKMDDYCGARLSSQRYADITVTVLDSRSIRIGDMAVNYKPIRIVGSNGTIYVDRYQFNSWGDFSALPAKDMITAIKFFTERRRAAQPSQRSAPALVHCSAGVGRTGTFVAAYHLLNLIDAGAKAVSVYNTVRSIRFVRPGAVQTGEQYNSIYDTIIEYVTRNNARTRPAEPEFGSYLPMVPRRSRQ